MERTISKAKTSRVNHATKPVSRPDVSAYCRDLDNWPRARLGHEKHLTPCEQLLASLRPFIAQLASSTLTRTAIGCYVDTISMLCGEIIRDLHYDPSLRKVAVERILCDVVFEDGGPLVHN